MPRTEKEDSKEGLRAAVTATVVLVAAKKAAVAKGVIQLWFQRLSRRRQNLISLGARLGKAKRDASRPNNAFLVSKTF